MLLLTAALALVWGLAVVYNFTIAWQYGLKALLMVLVSLLATLLSDVLVFSLKYKPEKGEYLSYLVNSVKLDYSWVTAMIFALTLPIGTPYYVVIMGALFATLIVKHVFGGFGHNIFNPAALGRVFVTLSFGSALKSTMGISGVVDQTLISGATITSWFSSSVSGFKWMGDSLTGSGLTMWQLWLGNYTGAIGETFTLAILLIAAVLIALNVMNWRTPVFYLGTVALTAAFIALIAGLNVGNYVLLHLSLGGLAFGAVFMLTDPVTSPTSPFGKALIGVIAGLITVLIRIQGSYPEGVVFAIALTNVVAPVIDRMATGMTNYKVWKKWTAVASFIVVSLGVSGGIAGGRVLGRGSSSSSSSSSSAPVPVRKVLHGTASSKVPAYDPNYEFTIEVDVSLSKEFDIVAIELTGEAVSDTANFKNKWNAGLQSILDSYTIYKVEELMVLGTAGDTPLNTTGVSISSNRLLEAVKDAFKDVEIYQGSGITDLAEDDPDYDLTYEGYLNGHQTDVTLYTVNDEISGFRLDNEITTGGNYKKAYERGVEALYDYYLGKTVDEVLATSQYPSDTKITGATVTSRRIYDGIIDALSKGPVIPAPQPAHLILHGAASSVVPAYDNDYEFEIEVNVSLTKEFSILQLEVTGEPVSSGANWTNKWTNGLQSLLDSYTIYTVEDLLALADSKTTPLNTTGVSISSNRVLGAVKDAFAGITVVTGSGITNYGEEDPDYDLTAHGYLNGMQTDATVYVIDSKIAGFRLDNKITTGGKYQTAYDAGVSAMYDYYLGKTVAEVLATSQYPTDSNITGATVTSRRIYDAVIDAVSKIV